MLESHTNGAGAPVARPSFPRFTDIPVSDVRHADNAAPITAHTSSQETLSLNIPADALLSKCWSKACEFAGNFGANQLSIEFLLLGATYVRDAEPVLASACKDVEQLSHALATHCAKRSFSPVPADKKDYHADPTLKELLCGSAAIAATQEMPRLTLSLLLEAIALHEPPLPVLEHLPALHKRKQPEPSAVVLLEQITDRLEAIENQISGPQVEVLEQSLPFPQRDGLADTVAKLQRDIATLKGHLIYYPSGPANPFEPQPQPHLVIPSREEMVRVIAELPKRIASAVVEELERPPQRDTAGKNILSWFRRQTTP